MKQRIIKFKAKRLDNGEWVEGDLYHRVDKYYITWADEKSRTRVPVDPFTVCQFTGLKDKDGKEIWEHDLISFHEKGESCEVIFEKGCFMALNSDNIPTCIITGIEHYDRDILVLGNKFDRKEEK